MGNIFRYIADDALVALDDAECQYCGTESEPVQQPVDPIAASCERSY
ncbi:hypothetical protein Pan216_39360 [Planctomycetes bacterium Pan216]|uniref:Uncharacterized protein n=1 Tax=Kolteria novifilia TaxID=2527975 RepID=A0A518B7W4_9BACT|nr:hypothetical protein Pan216_39360 [Planctomycetes bacterium Pan216]